MSTRTLPRTSLPDAATEPVLTAARFAAFSTMSLRGVYQAIERGEIPSVRVGKRVLIPTAAALRALGLAD